MFRKPDSSRLTPTDAIILHLETLREFRQRASRGEDFLELDSLTRAFEGVLVVQPPRLLVGAINDILKSLAGCPISDDEMNPLVRALNSNFGFKPDLLSDEKEE